MPSHILHVKIPPSLASTCKCHILHVISKSHPLWQVHAKTHLTRHIKIPPSLASTCQVTSYTSKSHPLWQVHASVTSYTSYQKSHPLLASTCKVTSYTSHQYPTLSGKYMPSHILHVISRSHPLWQVHAKSHLTRHINIPPSLASTCQVTSYTSKSHPLWQVHAKSHLTRHIKNPTLSGKYMPSHILQVKIPPSLASTCKCHILHVISKSHPLWQVHAKTHLTRHIKIPPSLASTCQVTSYTSYQISQPLWQVHAIVTSYAASDNHRPPDRWHEAAQRKNMKKPADPIHPSMAEASFTKHGFLHLADES